MPYKRPNEHYEHAPIREAIVDIQIEPPPTLSVASLDVPSIRASGYPKGNKLFRGQLIGRMEAERLTAQTESDQVGYQFLPEEGGKHVAQFRLDGFTFSRLTPYVTWEQLRDEARRVWMLF